MTYSKDITTEERHQLFDKLLVTINDLPEIEKFVLLELYRVSDLTNILKSKENFEEYIEKLDTVITAHKTIRSALPKLYDVLNRKDSNAENCDNARERKIGFFKSFKKNNDELK